MQFVKDYVITRQRNVKQFAARFDIEYPIRMRSRFCFYYFMNYFYVYLHIYFYIFLFLFP